VKNVQSCVCHKENIGMQKPVLTLSEQENEPSPLSRDSR
jgi:hypothetical protein